jgi:hypothetical protein
VGETLYNAAVGTYQGALSLQSTVGAALGSTGLLQAAMGVKAPRDPDEAFAALIREAQEEDLESVASLGVFVEGLKDKEGRPALVILGRNFPATSPAADPQKALRYLSLIVEEIGRQPFSVIYVHTGARYAENYPGKEGGGRAERGGGATRCLLYRALPAPVFAVSIISSLFYH